MKYKLTIESDSLDEIYEAVSGLRTPATVMMKSSQSGDGDKPSEASTKEKKARKAHAAVSSGNVVSIVSEETKTEERVTDTGADTQENADVGKTAPPPVFRDVQVATTALVATKGKQAALDLLATFDAKKPAELKPEQYAEFIAAAKDAVKGE